MKNPVLYLIGIILVCITTDIDASKRPVPPAPRAPGPSSPMDTIIQPPADTGNPVPPDPVDPPVDTVTPPPADTATPPPDPGNPPPADTVTPPVNVPTAVISGTEQICPGQQATLSISLTGTAPWQIDVRKDGQAYASINNIPVSHYNLNVNEPGVYTIANVTDAESSGTGNGSGTVTLQPVPVAALEGGQNICNDADAELSVSFTGESPWRFSYTRNSGPPQMVQDVSENPYHFSVTEAGSYTLHEVYDQLCKGTVSGIAIVEFSDTPEVTISGLNDYYSQQSQEWVELHGSPAGGDFSGNGVIEYNNTWYFIPALAPVGSTMIIYQYQESTESCHGYDTAQVRIFEVSADIAFESDRTKYCINDSPFLVTGLSLGGNTEQGTFSISGNSGLTDNGDNTAIIDPSKLTTNEYTITFITENGEMVSRNFEIGDALVADFRWDTECFTAGQPVVLNNTSESPYGYLSGSSYKWTVHTNNAAVQFSNKDIVYSFDAPGNYNIDLTIENSNGCKDTVTKTLVLNPVIQLAGRNYFEDFENTSSWQAGKSIDSKYNSWVLGNPVQQGFTDKGFDGAYSGIKSWYTHIPGNLAPPEKSWITSPCFDFTGTEKPAIVARIWRSLADNRDGVNLQYSPDKGQTWVPVGQIGDGINWHTGYFGQSSSQTTGWTGIKDDDWIEIRHALDFLNDEPLVQFRFAYTASGSALGNDGIAIDDIAIVERNKMILIEHFTNSSDNESADADERLTSLAQRYSTNIIDIRYHTSNPPDDPFNEDNPSVPNTRQFFYNLSGVPYAIVNGGTKNNQRIDFKTTHLSEQSITVESLYDSEFLINVKSMTASDYVYVDAEITTLTDLPPTELSVRMAVIEPVITGITGENGSTTFRNVVRGMIPDAAGYNMYREWIAGEKVVLQDKWEVKNAVDPSALRVVVFIQNESTREVYQAAMDTRAVLTGSDPFPVNTAFHIFPNPAKDLLTIQFATSTAEEIKLELISTAGTLVYSSQWPAGKSSIELPVSMLAPGLYMLRISTGEGVLGNSKIMIIP